MKDGEIGPETTRRSGRTVALLLAVVLGVGAFGVPPADAQSERPARTGALERLVFAPDLVISHQREIGLTPGQKDAVVREMQQMQSELVPLQIEMAEAAESLGRLLRELEVDEETAVATARRVMDLETEIKTHHLRLVVRIKNLLSPEQQATLRQIRARKRAQRAQTPRAQ